MTTLTPTRDVPARGRHALQRSIAWYLRQLSKVLNVLTDEELDDLEDQELDAEFEAEYGHLSDEELTALVNQCVAEYRAELLPQRRRRFDPR